MQKSGESVQFFWGLARYGVMQISTECLVETLHESASLCINPEFPENTEGSTGIAGHRHDHGIRHKNKSTQSYGLEKAPGKVSEG